ncbi:hypothetical protein B0T14DRAFT_323496 [Immersiella caudata]|uniref:Uncharacterized protein n=1 Tax=Immersiella caudata TaxID=314043 RepID=A0AA39T1J4_9PEZI|nr:hypothetical protein B0T14DRAFT_323496 [Immersiella caudata]
MRKRPTKKLCTSRPKQEKKPKRLPRQPKQLSYPHPQSPDIQAATPLALLTEAPRSLQSGLPNTHCWVQRRRILKTTSDQPKLPPRHTLKSSLPPNFETSGSTRQRPSNCKPPLRLWLPRRPVLTSRVGDFMMNVCEFGLLSETSRCTSTEPAISPLILKCLSSADHCLNFKPRSEFHHLPNTYAMAREISELSRQLQAGLKQHANKTPPLPFCELEPLLTAAIFKTRQLGSQIISPLETVALATSEEPISLLLEHSERLLD